MTEHALHPLQSPAKGLVLREHEPRLWRIVALRYRAFLSRGGGIFYVGIPPDPDSPEASVWSFRDEVEIAVLPPASFRIGQRDENGGVISDEFITEQIRVWIIHSDGSVHRATPSNDPRDKWQTLNWPREATALRAPDRMLHGWDPQWGEATPTTILGRPGTRVPRVLTIPGSDPRAYGDELQPHWFDVSTETAEVVIDDEHGVILEWNGLVDDQVFEHSAFTAIDFDAELTERDFDPDALGLTNLWI